MYIFIFWYHISVGKYFLFSQSLFYYHPWYPNGKMCWFLVHFVMAWFGTTSSSTTHNLSTSTSIAKSEVESMRMCFADRYENNINRTNDEILNLMYCTTSLETQWSDDFNTFFFLPNACFIYRDICKILFMHWIFKYIKNGIASNVHLYPF